MKAIDNSGFLNVCHSCQTTGFVPACTYSFNTSTKVLTVVNTSTYPSGDSLNVVNITVSDKFGNQKTVQINSESVSATETVALATGFNVSKGFNILATVVSTNRLSANLAVYDVNQLVTNSGSLN